MYQTYVPLMNYSVTQATRATYLKQLQEAQVDKIFLAIFGYGDDPKTDYQTADALRENIAFFRENGIEAGVWIGCTIGHGGELAFGADHVPDLSGYTKMMSLEGKEKTAVCCPFDVEFRKRVAAYVGAIATSGAQIVLLDDDFRISHGSGYCCACDLHMKRIHELCGEQISREALREQVFTGKANKYRDAFLQAQGEALSLLAADIRAAVNKTAPTVRVGLCASPWLFGVDASDPVALARLLAGEQTKPFLRICAAPYWSVIGKDPMPCVLEMARLHAHLCRENGLEVVSEGDTYPRPAYNMPASILEMFDAAMRMDGQCDGILKYMVDYNATPEFEPAYLKRHVKDLDVLAQIDGMFGAKEALGVNVSIRRDLLAQADLSLGGAPTHFYHSVAGGMMAMSSIPSVYGAGGVCPAIFGEEARHVALSDLEKGAVLDGVAAAILAERGVDVGLAERPAFTKKSALWLSDSAEIERAVIFPSEVYHAPVKLSAGAKTVCKIAFPEGSDTLAYRYENAEGARFLVWCFDGVAHSKHAGVFRGYLQQQVLREGIEWISGQALPAFAERCPNLYVMCKGDGERMAVGLFNFFADSVEEPVIRLGRAYTGVRFLNCSGKLQGDKVLLDAPLNAYAFAAFEVW